MLFAFPAFAYDFEINGLYYNIVSVPESTCELVKGDVPYKGNVVIPESVEYRNRQFSVIGIGDATFGYRMDGVCNTELMHVNIPSTIKYIGNYAFKGCVSLKTISIPNSVITVEEYAFDGCKSLQTVSLPSSLTEIEDNTFADCALLQNITIPGSVRRIGNKVFKGCTSLQTVSIPNSVSSVGIFAFENCTSLQTVSIPNSVSKIGSGAFANCISLQTVSIPNSVSSIERSTFQNCESLETFTVSGFVTEIGLRAFKGCKKLNKVTFENGSSQLYFDTYADYKIDNFDGCENLTTIALGRNLGYLDPNYKNDIKPVYIPGGLFSNLTTLKVLKDYNPWQISLLFIDIQHLLFEDGVDFNEVEYLLDLTKLQTLTLESTTPPVCPNFSNDQYLNVILYVPAGTLSVYQKADGWKYFFDIREVDVSGVNEIQYESRRAIGRYDINGNRVDEDFKGIKIVKYSDGSTKKYINR